MRVAFRLGSSFVLLFLIVLGGCQLLGASGGEPIPADSRIEFMAGGGWGGLTLYDLTVSEDGLVTNRAVTPNLKRQLSPDEHRQLLDVFYGFAALPDRVGECNWSDDAFYQVTVRQDGNEQTTYIMGCALSGHGNGPGLARMGGIVTALIRLSEEIYDTQAPWRGLEVAFSTDRQEYHPGDPITITARVRNPASGARSLFFEPDTERIGFRLDRRNGSNFYFTYPERDARWEPEVEPKVLEEVVIGPGEEQVFTLVWDGSVPDSGGEMHTLAPGEYALWPYLRDTSGRFRSDFVVISVVDG